MGDHDRNEHSAPTSSDAVEPAGGDRRIRMAAVGSLAVVLAAGSLLGSTGLFSVGDPQPPSSTDTTVADDARIEDVRRIADLGELPPGGAEHVEVAYFHRTHRCWSCTEAERLTRLALDDGFAEDLATGRVSVVVVDVEQPENAGLAARYEAWGSSLFLGISKAGATYVYPVSDIWFTISDEAAFVRALQEKITMALGE